jgi:hypothetical protein
MDMRLLLWPFEFIEFFCIIPASKIDANITLLDAFLWNIAGPRHANGSTRTGYFIRPALA